MFKMCLVRRITANLCPIMIYFYALDFNVCRSEEVISFSLYVRRTVGRPACNVNVFQFFVFCKFMKDNISLHMFVQSFPLKLIRNMKISISKLTFDSTFYQK